MRIEITKQIDAETRETWSFNILKSCLVFTGWRREVKPKGKRKWAVEKFWDKYRKREPNMVSEPELPESIKSEILIEFMKDLKVSTWDEWAAGYSGAG